jgi:hypothetical protein
MPGSRDRWWAITTYESSTLPTPTDVALDVVGAIRDYGMPWLRQQLMGVSQIGDRRIAP